MKPDNMITTLCFDFGNTRLKCAVFRNTETETVLVLENDLPETAQRIMQQYQPQRVILSSVIHHNPEFENIIAQNTRFHKLNHQSRLPFTIPVGKPETVGADRLALCAAAAFFHPNKNNLVIALGSCITYNFINQQRQFMGGGISPGLEFRLKSLNQYTALLPQVKPEPIIPLIGYDTKTNILSGTILGMAAEIDGMVEAYNCKFGNFNAILTGGDSSYFAPHLKNKIFADANFIYKGLYAICEFNQS
jgi:type III pantothenate kinase